MFAFLKKVRRTLIESGSFRKPASPFSRYLFYAIGEIALVVIGILIALQINNWNENRKLEQRRKALISEMISDFETTKNRLNISARAIDRSLRKIEQFVQLAIQKDTTVSIDTLKYLAGGAWEKPLFQPAMSSYKTAMSTGDIGLLNNKRLNELFSEFLLGYEDYQHHWQMSGANQYVSGFWELRKKLGSIYTLKTPTHRWFELAKDFALPADEYYQVIRQPDVTATFENTVWLLDNMQGALLTMEETTKEILEELNKSK